MAMDDEDDEPRRVGMDNDVNEIYGRIWTSFVGVSHPAQADLAVVRVMELRPSVELLERARVQIAEDHKRSNDDHLAMMQRPTADSQAETDQRLVFAMEVAAGREEDLDRRLVVLDRCLAVADLDGKMSARRYDRPLRE